MMMYKQIIKVFTVALVAMGLTFQAQAGFVEPTGDVSSAKRIFASQDPSAKVVAAPKKTAPVSQWNQLKKKVTNFWETQSKKWFGGSDDTKNAKQAPNPVVPTQPDPVDELAKNLPNYKTEKKLLNDADLKEAQSQLEKGPTRVAVPGRLGDPSLPKNKVGVPVVPAFNKKTVGKKGNKKTVFVVRKKLPKLNIGLEETIEANDLLINELRLAKVPKKTAEALKSPKSLKKSQFKNELDRKIAKATDIEDPRKLAKLASELVTQKMIDKIKLGMLTDKPYTELDYKEFQSKDLKMLAGLILFKKKKQCPILLGLFDELRKEEKYKNAAEFHLGACAQKLKLYTTAFKYLSKVIAREDMTYSKEALRLLSADMPRENEPKFAKLILGLKNASLISSDIQDGVYYRVAKGAYESKRLKETRSYAAKVSLGSKFSLDAQYLEAIATYALGNLKEADAKLTELRARMEREKINDKNMNSLTAINLARIRFSRGNYKGSLELYKQIDKDNALWVKGLIELGWAQLMSADPAGAIGNMYSLHSPYFRAVYKPESFVVRTIGYLNICQYGDAYRTLSMLEEKHRPWYNQVSTYIQTNKKSPSKYYNTVIQYLSGKSQNGVAGLPYQVIREMARQKPFLNAQTSLNNSFDEIDRYKKVFAQINKAGASFKWHRGKSKGRYNKARALLAKSKKDSSLAPQVNQIKAQIRSERDIIDGYTYLIKLAADGKKTYKQLNRRAREVIAKTQRGLRSEAGVALAKNLRKVKAEMGRMLDNNEFLRYEVFAGSGQNIRYQVAGGNVKNKNRIPASIKPSKSLNWSFDGEYWEDEIGAYRSSLKNNCPKVGQYALPKKNKG